MLQNGHNLFKLCKAASNHDKEFNKFLKECAFLNAFYIETRYPAEEALVAEKEDVEEAFKISENIMRYIKKKL